MISKQCYYGAYNNTVYFGPFALLFFMFCDQDCAFHIVGIFPSIQKSSRRERKKARKTGLVGRELDCNAIYFFYLRVSFVGVARPPI